MVSSGQNGFREWFLVYLCVEKTFEDGQHVVLMVVPSQGEHLDRDAIKGQFARVQ
jgi:hypothetical protein